MPNTGPGTSHRHKTRDGKWSDLTDLASGDDHVHPFAETRYPADTFTDGEVVKLKALLTQVTPAPPEPVPTPPTGNLQQIIDGTLPGGSVDLTGWTGSGRAVVNKPMTIKGGLLTVPAGGPGLTVTANDVRLLGFSAKGAQSSVYTPSEKGLLAENVSGLSIEGGSFSNFGYGGIYVRKTPGVVIDGVLVEDAVYAGIAVLSGKTGLIRRATVRRVGHHGIQQPDQNAYGIFVSYQAGEPKSEDVTIEDSLVEDVPLWHGFDEHPSIRTVFRRCTTRRVSRPFWVTGIDTLMEDCRAESPDPVTYNIVAGVTMSGAQNAKILRTFISSKYWNGVYNYGGSTYTETGTVRG